MNLDIACISRAGGRPVNEDSVGYEMANGSYCLIVADGVGGYDYGDYASQTAVQKMKETFQANNEVTASTVRRNMETVANHISKLICNNSHLDRMRTTLAVLCINDKRCVSGHIGDSRVYIFRFGEIFYVSQDHSTVMQMVLRGELGIDEIRGHPKRNLLISAIGKSSPKKLDTASFEMSMSSGDGILICSDGFWELIAENEMLTLLSYTKTASHWLREMEIIVGNRLYGRSDNYTCLAART